MYLLLPLLLLTMSSASPTFFLSKCPVCEPQYCPASADDCPRGIVRDVCDCCPTGVCVISVGERCLDTSHTPAISLTDLRVYTNCGHGMECRVRDDVDPTQNPKESTCACLETTPVCSTDNTTYASSCALHGDGARLAHTGPCAVAPHITVAPISSISTLDSSVALGCEVYGVPVPSIVWKFKGFDGTSKTLPGDDTSMVVHSRGGPESSMVTSWMQLMSARVADSGIYTCIATNGNGQAQAQARVIVNPVF